MIARQWLTSLLCFQLSLAAWVPLGADDAGKRDQLLFDSLQFRCLGPLRGGRSAAVTGVPNQPRLFYMGSAGGGVWRTNDAGASWENISDGYFGGSMGAIAVAPSDSNVIYAGGGEKSVRGNVSHGEGVWKSEDAGQTWRHVGLDDSRHIPRIRIHPQNPDLVYAAVLGHLFGPNQQRGVFRSRDGGKNWERVLFVSEEAGAFDLILDPNNPRIVYATTWKVRRTPYSLESGGEGSGIWKSTDSGDSWQEITHNPGLPADTIGICGIAVSPLDSNRVWAMVEAEEGGLFRSDDGGGKWKRINSERKLRQRAWYYSRIYAGPRNVNEVYVLNVRFWRSVDGGDSFSAIRTPHGDHHDLWINPENPDRMIIGDDGGAQVSLDRGASWSTYMNQPTAQFYRVTTDNHFPYRIYGAQQDNSTVRIAHRNQRSRIGERDWEPTAGGESGYLAPDPNDPEIVYGGSYGGYLAKYNHRTGEVRSIDVWPDNPLGRGAGDNRFRFQWNFPLFFSQHDSNTLFAAANVLFQSKNGGDSWTQISGDLTRNAPAKMGPSGGPITKDNTGVEYYCTIFAATESRHDPQVIWAGSDDGLLHVTRDGGQNWIDVTPIDMPEWMQVNCIEPHPTEPGGLYVAGTRYKLDDFKPYLYRTTDFGKTWVKLVDGIDRKHFTRTIRADPDRPGLLYAGTESGLYISFDDGQQWRPFQCNLPIVPITDLAIQNKDLIVATQGRSFWILDDLSTLHQWDDEIVSQPVKLFCPRPGFRMRGGSSSSHRMAGRNADGGVTLNFWVKELPAETATCRLVIQDESRGESVVFNRVRSGDKKAQDRAADDDWTVREMNVQPGLNQINWDMRFNGAQSFDGLVLWGGGLQGPRVAPGKFSAELSIGEFSERIEFEVLPDPRSSATSDDFESQLDFLLLVRDKLTEMHQSIENLRGVRQQINALIDRIAEQESYSRIVASGRDLVDRLNRIEKKLYQTRNQSPQDPLNYPMQLNNRLSALVGVVSMGDNRPTQQSVLVRDQLIVEIDEQLRELAKIFDDDIGAFNRQVRQARVPAILIAP